MVTRILALAILVIASEQIRFKVTATAQLATGSSSTRELGRSAESGSELPTDAPASVRSEPATLSSRPDHRRPIWAIAHMVNSIKELELRLKTGANGIEADVTFNRDGEPIYTYHGPPCDCWRHCNQQEIFIDYLSFIREVSIESTDGLGQQLTMLFLDLKLDSLDQQAKERAGRELAKLIVNNLFLRNNQQQVGRPFRLIISINHVNDIDLVRNFIHTLEMNNSSHLLEDNIGFDVGMNDDLQSIESMWQKLSRGGTNLNLWQGDGFTNCLSPFYNLERLSRAVARRDDPQGYPDKVYHWTIDLHDRIRESLLMGVDAIMTNHPERLLTVLKEPMIAHDLRLATRADDPFKKLTRRLVGRSNEAARYQRSAYTPSGGFLYSLIDVLASWLNYMREIPLLSYPTTLMSRSSSSLAKQRIGASKPPLARTTTTTTATKGDNSSFTMNVTRVALQTEPVYRMLTNATDVTAIQENHPATLEDASNPSDAQVDYDGPRWYTSLVSNVLVSVMRILMPVS